MSVSNYLSVSTEKVYPLSNAALTNVNTVVSRAILELDGNFTASNVQNKLSKGGKFQTGLGPILTQVDGVYYSYCGLVTVEDRSYLELFVHPGLPLNINLFSPDATIPDTYKEQLEKVVDSFAKLTQNRLVENEYRWPEETSPPKKVFTFTVDIENDIDIAGGKKLALAISCGYA